MNIDNAYDLETYIADVYDQVENHLDDVNLLKKLIRNKNLRILELFCGTGRMSIPFIKEGHYVIGIDSAKGMLDWYKKKLKKLNISEGYKLIEANALTTDWPTEVDLIILGCNCFYELATKEEQELCIKKASESLNPGGFIYIDNDHMEGDLDESWQEKGIVRKSICGIAQDGSKVETTWKTIWFDVKERLAKFERKAKITKPNGETIESSFIQQKHPVSTYEVKNWLEKHGFKIEKLYGDWNEEAYTDESDRAIFWARKWLKKRFFNWYIYFE